MQQHRPPPDGRALTACVAAIAAVAAALLLLDSCQQAGATPAPTLSAQLPLLQPLLR